MLVKVGDAPINPSDLGMMFAGSRLERATGGDGSVRTTVTAGLDAMAGRFGKPMPCGNEGGGTVIATGSRALQFAASPPHFDLGKSRDSYGPIGPVMVPADLLPDRDAVLADYPNIADWNSGVDASCSLGTPTGGGGAKRRCELTPGATLHATVTQWDEQERTVIDIGEITKMQIKHATMTFTLDGGMTTSARDAISEGCRAN
ncbi:MAG: SRPBCC family protein [Ilumatobacteraceae bacterium]|nr:SRPBCC family protein [Ilumatobacteraceae bacterium]